MRVKAQPSFRFSIECTPVKEERVEAPGDSVVAEEGWWLLFLGGESGWVCVCPDRN